MSTLTEHDRAERSALAYADRLEQDGYDVAVYRYVTALDNRDPGHRQHREADGYAVRYTSSDEMDRRIHDGTPRQRRGLPALKFHDRSITVFASQDLGLDKLVGASVVADIPGEDPAAMWAGAYSPAEGPNAPEVPYVIMKRFRPRDPDDRHPWRIGPSRCYHLIMTPVTR